LFLGVTAPVSAQRDKEDKQDKHEQQGKPEKQQGQAKGHQGQPQGQAKGQKGRQQQGQARQQQRAPQQRQQQARRPSQQEQHGRAVEHRDAWQQHRARSWKSEHRTWQQRGGYNGYRIPDDRFRSSFGRSHWFRIYRQPVLVVGGYPRFQYGGFWFSLVDPWPEYWAPNWYETDDVYIDYYGDGYYLYNRRRPGVRIAINVFVN
jgi:hypothetical protein